MRKLSVVIITFNEAKNIGRCLASVADIADEIVVVDSFSTDTTREICAQYKVQFFEHAFEGHIQQKNWAITQAKNHFILSLDADEALDNTLIEEIRRVKKTGTADGFKMSRMTNYCGQWIKHGSWYPDIKLRLWDSRKGAWGGINPHDEYLMEEGSKIEKLKGDILHYSYPNLDDYLRQQSKFTDIQAKSMYDRGKRVSTLKIFVNPWASFVKDIIIRSGYLDGYFGFEIAVLSAYSTFLKYIKLRRYQNGHKPDSQS